MYAVTFDLWNTLLGDHNYARMPEFLAAGMVPLLKEAGFVVDETYLAQVILECRDLTMSRQVNEGLELVPEEQLAWILGRVGVAAPGWLDEKLLAFYTADRSSGKIRVMEGTEETLAKLAKKYSLALICNTGRTPGRVVRPLLERIGLKDFFQILTFSNELRMAKPNPRVFLYTLEQLGVDPARAAHIGDDLRTDVKGSKEAGMVPIWLNRHKRDGCPEGVYEVDQLTALPPLLEEIWG